MHKRNWRLFNVVAKQQMNFFIAKRIRHVTFLVGAGIPARANFEAEHFWLKILLEHLLSSFINHSSKS